ncbi:MAG: fasciclin domain-containing protein [Steroidobacteraceae bacterium]
MFTRTTMLGVTALCAVLVAGLGFAPEAEAGKKRKRAQQQSAAGYVAATPSLVDVAIAANTEGPYAGSFDILLAAVGAAEPVVATALSTRGQLTVFAPTDTAFEALLAELGVTAEDLLASTEQLTDVLLYHVSNGRQPSNAVLGKRQIRMLKGGFVYQSNGILTDNNGREVGFVVTDIPASNGVIHVIDTVLLP